MSRRVLVTGGSMGIGRACAERLAAEGWRVVVCARGRDEIERTVAALPGSGHASLVLDVSSEEEWIAAAAELSELDGLVHAAAVIDPIGRFTEVDMTEVAETLRINVLGTFLALRSCAPALDRSSGRAVVFSGGGATGPLERYDAYAASKAATVRLVENLARDGVAVNAVAPGFVATRMRQATLEAGPEAAGETDYRKTVESLEGETTPPDLAAGLVSFLLSPEADGIAGKLISAPWDPWREPEFLERLRSDRDFATVRRIDDHFFARVDG